MLACCRPCAAVLDGPGLSLLESLFWRPSASAAACFGFHSAPFNKAGQDYFFRRRDVGSYLAYRSK
jgi:hypothetical protein